MAEFAAKELRQGLAKPGTGTLYIEPGVHGRNGLLREFQGKLQNECLNGEIFYSLKEVQIVIENADRIQHEATTLGARL